MEWLSSLPSWLVIIVIGASILLESGFVAGMVLPGTTAVIAMGVMAGLGVIPTVPAYAVAILAAIAGPTLGWRAGVIGGPAVRTSKVGQFVGDSRWAAAEKVMERRGSQAVLFAQFVVVARTLVPLLVGMSGTTYRRFALASIPAAVVWAGALTTAGLLAGESYDVVTQTLGSATISVGIIAGLMVGLAWIGRQFAAGAIGAIDPLTPAGPHSLVRLQHRVEQRLVRLTGPHVAPVVASVMWWVVAVVIGVASIVATIWAVRRTPLHRVDQAVGAWLDKYPTPPEATVMGERMAQVLSTANVLLLAYLATIVILVAFRGRLGHASRLRIITTTLGLAALGLATGVVADLIQRRLERGFAVDFLFDRQLAVVPCALAVIVALVSPWIARRWRVSAWSVVVLLVTMVLWARIITEQTRVTEGVVALAVGVAWSVLLASAIRYPHVAEHPQDSESSDLVSAPAA